MTWLNLIVLAVVQGITEFLPISSSAHLILVPCLADWPDQGLDMDIAMHVGTLGAVMLYFWREYGKMIWACGRRGA
jgi:undecaprenyl-diphosphatase